MIDRHNVIVVGSGADPGTLTHAPARTGKRTLLLETGGFLPRAPRNWDCTPVWVDLRYHNSGAWTEADVGEEFAPKQNYMGNTMVCEAILFRFRERHSGTAGWRGARSAAAAGGPAVGVVVPGAPASAGRAWASSADDRDMVPR